MRPEEIGPWDGAPWMKRKGNEQKAPRLAPLPQAQSQQSLKLGIAGFWEAIEQSVTGALHLGAREVK
jgi:hypothetical protein